MLELDLIDLFRAHWLSTLTFLVGLLAGHWFSLFRDRRKEFNDAAASIRAALLINHHSLPNLTWPTRGQLEAVAERLPWWRRKGFREAWGDYEYCIGENHTEGTDHAVLDDPVRAERLARACLRYCRIR